MYCHGVIYGEVQYKVLEYLKISGINEGGHYFSAYINLFQCINAKMHQKTVKEHSCFIILKSIVSSLRTLQLILSKVVKAYNLLKMYNGMLLQQNL